MANKTHERYNVPLKIKTNLVYVVLLFLFVPMLLNAQLSGIIWLTLELLGFFFKHVNRKFNEWKLSK